MMKSNTTMSSMTTTTTTKALGTTATAGSAALSNNNSSNLTRPDTARPRPQTARKLLDPTARRESTSRNGDSLQVGGQLGERKSSILDPLSQQIIQRTAQSPQPSCLQEPREVPLDANHLARIPTETFQSDTVSLSGVAASISTKDRRKTGSFLSRIIGNKKKEIVEEETDSASEQADERPEGADAELFYQPVDNFEFAPRNPPPPAYIKVRSQGKKQKQFDRMFLAQELSDEEFMSHLEKRESITSISKLRKTHKHNDDAGAVWALEISKDGKYLAAAGQDTVVRLWNTIASRSDRRAFEREEEAQDSYHLSAPVFSKKPFRRFEAHTAAVLDLSWSKNNFLLSSSMDKTVRLWHVTRAECLCTFKHSDFVTSIQFHPRDDRFFLAGSLDSKLRLWSIPDKSVAYWVQISEIITAVSFTPDGKVAIAGCLNGACLFYETEGFRYASQMLVRSTHGKNAKGSKITGIETINMPPNDPHGDIKLLVTSNDSRVRLYNYRDKSLEMKFKGTENLASQIHARFSDDGKYIICGSEDNRVFIWSVQSINFDRKAKHPVEVFEAHNAITTVCAIAPVKTRQLLGNSEDPIYDVCNPPPVTLVSRSEAESIRSFVGGGQNDASSIMQTPATAEGGSFLRRPEESPGYLARSTHTGGNIIVTADATGAIKVFRQDCAHEKRRNDAWETSSIMSKKIGLHRQSSVTTRASTLSRKGSNSSQPAPERILSWRQNISSSANSSDNGSPTPRKASEHGSIHTVASHGGSGKSHSRLASIRTSLGRVGSSSSSARTPKLLSGAMLEQDELVAEPDSLESLPSSRALEAKKFPLPKMRHAATLPTELPSVQHYHKLSPDSSPPTPGRSSPVSKRDHHHLNIRVGSSHGHNNSRLPSSPPKSRNFEKAGPSPPVIVVPPTPSDSHSSLPSISVAAPSTNDDDDEDVAPDDNTHPQRPAPQHQPQSHGHGHSELDPGRRSSNAYWREDAWKDPIQAQLEQRRRRSRWSAAFSDVSSVLALSKAPTRDGYLAASANAGASTSAAGKTLLVNSNSQGASPSPALSSTCSASSGAAAVVAGAEEGISGDTGGCGAEMGLMPPVQRSVSAVSALTSEMSSGSDAEGGQDEEEQQQELARHRSATMTKLGSRATATA